MEPTHFLAGLFAVVLFLFSMPTNTQSPAPLSPRQQAIVTIAARTATGDLPHLHHALAHGLDADLTVNEAKEVLVHLYAYCGFPRSLQGLNTLMKVLDERKAKGMQDVVGKEASPITSTAPKYERGKQNLETLTKRPEMGPKTGVNAFSPEIDVFLKEHLFADIFERDVLSFQDRELATIAALVALGGVEPMLQAHLGMGMNTGLTKPQLQQLLALEETSVSIETADTGRAALTKVLELNKK